MSKNDRIPKNSFTFNGWLRLRTLCKALRQTEDQLTQLKQLIDVKLKVTQQNIDKHSDVQASRASIENIESLLEAKKRSVMTLSARLSLTRRRLGEKKSLLMQFRDSVSDRAVLLDQLRRDHICLRERVLWSSAQIALRRKQLIQDTVFIFSITDSRCKLLPKSHVEMCESPLSISGVHLPGAESFLGHNDIDISVGLGYVALLLDVLSRLFDIPLRYSIVFFNSRSSIIDNIDHQLENSNRKFPLFSKESDKIVFSYAVFLLNKNIAQLRYEFGVSTKDLRETLANIRSLLERLIEAKIDYRFLQKPLRIHVSPNYSSSNVSYACSNTSLFSEPTSDPGYNSYKPQASFRLRSKLPPNIDNGNSLPKYSNSCENLSKICRDLTISANINNNNDLRLEISPIDESSCMENLRTLNIKSPNKHKFMENCKKLLKTCYLSSEKLDEQRDFGNSNNLDFKS